MIQIDPRNGLAVLDLKRTEPRCFAVFLQWRPQDIIVQENDLTWDEAWDALRGYREAPRPPYRCAMALVVRPC